MDQGVLCTNLEILGTLTYKYEVRLIPVGSTLIMYLNLMYLYTTENLIGTQRKKEKNRRKLFFLIQYDKAGVITQHICE